MNKKEAEDIENYLLRAQYNIDQVVDKYKPKKPLRNRMSSIRSAIRSALLTLRDLPKDE
jgi:hypothetical protein